MDWANVLQSLWDFTISIITWTSEAWEWLNTPIVVEFLGKEWLNFTPLLIFGSGLMITILIFAIIKAFIPGA